ncbi:MAG TPA: MGMT family protein [Thermoanaerobaculia bacterium]|nr:MGMT family protein [Thermoanaerobaculia bacterium]
MATANNRYQLIWKIVAKIPRGRVATYGQIAELAGLEGHARQVGYALHNLPEGSRVPWHRVINAQGEVSPRTGGDSHELQRLLLEAEGVAFDARGRVDLKRFRWGKVVRSQLSVVRTAVAGRKRPGK